MKVLILGTGKTGTTVMVYKVAGGLPNCHAFSGGPLDSDHLMRIKC